MSSLPESASYYLDTAAMWKYYRDEPGDVQVRRLVSRSPVLVSPLTMLEFIAVLMRYYRRRCLRRKDVHAIARRLRRDSALGRTSRPFQVIQIPEGAFRQAEGFLLQYADQCRLGANDALHLAIAIRHRAADPIVFVTSDGALKQVAKRQGVPCYDPALDP